MWSSHFDRDTDSLQTDDSVVYVFGDTSVEDILYISSVVNHLTGDESLDGLFRKLAPNIKGWIFLDQEDNNNCSKFQVNLYHMTSL